MDRPDLTVSNFMDISIDLKRVKDPTFTCFTYACTSWYLSHTRKCAHAYVYKVRYSMGYFDSENAGGISSKSALFSMKISIFRERSVEYRIEFLMD